MTAESDNKIDEEKWRPADEEAHEDHGKNTGGFVFVGKVLGSGLKRTAAVDFVGDCVIKVRCSGLPSVDCRRFLQLLVAVAVD